MRNRKAGYACKHCPVETTLDIIGGKWKGVILYHIMTKTRRFNEMRRLMPGVSQRMLTLQLRELEKDGVIHREIFPVVPPKTEYSLTAFGETLKPIIQEMKRWGDYYEQTHQDVQERNIHTD
jgi:DNA-binding HxlR family transcriptional regulator